jgi:hypothetical protein
MQKCPNCGTVNRVGVVFCDSCGTSLSGQSPLGTRTIGSLDPAQAPFILPKQSDPPATLVLPNIPKRDALAGTGHIKPGMSIRIVVSSVEGMEPFVVQAKREIILGRKDPATGGIPDIDLAAYAGYRMGVSRRHAALRISTETRLELWDLGSSNGTHLNGIRLAAHRPNPVQDGDEIRLGQMVMHIYFLSAQTGEKAADQ